MWRCQLRPVRGLTRDASAGVNTPSPNTSETAWWGGGMGKREWSFSSSLLIVEMAKFLGLSLLEMCPRLSCRLLSPTTQNFGEGNLPEDCICAVE